VNSDNQPDWPCSLRPNAHSPRSSSLTMARISPDSNSRSGRCAASDRTPNEGAMATAWCRTSSYTGTAGSCSDVATVEAESVKEGDDDATLLRARPPPMIGVWERNAAEGVLGLSTRAGRNENGSNRGEGRRADHEAGSLSKVSMPNLPRQWLERYWGKKRQMRTTVSRAHRRCRSLVNIREPTFGLQHGVHFSLNPGSVSIDNKKGAGYADRETALPSETHFNPSSNSNMGR
jgi:hypothetical protein